MSLGLVYLIVAVVAVGCGFIDRKKAKSNLSMVAAVVMLAGVAYAGINYSWFHLLGLVGITLIGMNLFTFLENSRKRREEEQKRVDAIFNVEDEDEE